MAPSEDLPPLQPNPPLPKASFSSIQERLRAARNLPTVGENEPGNLTDDDLKEGQREIWQRMGYYSNHPNHNPTAIDEAHIKSMMERSHKLGKVVAKYRLLVNKPTGKRAMLIQYPNRKVGQEYRAASGNKPSEIRIKPKCGLVEIDIPVDIHDNYHKEKGVEFGEAIRKSRLLQEGGSYSLGGGLGMSTKIISKSDRRVPPPEGPSHEKLLENFDDANNKGHVMNKITLGGQIYPFKSGDPIYMAATFKDDICTWTKMDAIVQLRTQFGHIDALNEAKKTMFRSERGPDIRDNVEEEPEARAVNMAVKSTEGSEEDMYGGMRATAKLLRDMRDEPWQRLAWVDQDELESYEIYNDALVYQDPDSAPQLVSEMTNEQYLDAISCPRIDPIKQGQKVMAQVDESLFESEDGDEKIEITDDTENEDDDDEDEEEYETLPEGAIRPDDCVAERRIERIARAICIRSVNEQAFYEGQMKQKFLNDPKWAKHSFLLPSDRYHIYYKYRIAENRAGRGIDPEYDTFEVAAVPRGRHSSRA